LYGALGAVFVLVPYLMINAAHYSATAAGAALCCRAAGADRTLPLMEASPVTGSPPLTIGPWSSRLAF
jgi:hypothetical protein